MQFSSKNVDCILLSKSGGHFYRIWHDERQHKSWRRMHLSARLALLCICNNVALVFYCIRIKYLCCFFFCVWKVLLKLKISAKIKQEIVHIWLIMTGWKKKSWTIFIINNFSKYASSNRVMKIFFWEGNTLIFYLVLRKIIIAKSWKPNRE